MATTHRTEHGVRVAAPVDQVYDLLADVGAWPWIFPPTVHAERVDGDDTDEVIRLWASAGETVKTWTSRRSLDRAAGRVTFRQEVPAHPVAAMGGEWLLAPDGAGGATVRLLHDFVAVDDDPANVEWITAAIDRNSEAELKALRRIAELGPALAEVVLTFDDSVVVAGLATAAYEFINRADLWPERLPHVQRVEFTEPEPGLQVLEMDTRAVDGSVHTTRSIRVGQPPERIVYKQQVLPKLLTAHAGQWLFRQTDDGTVITSRHTVAIARSKVREVLGAAAGVLDARDYVRDALGNNSRATLKLAKEYAEGGVA